MKNISREEYYEAIELIKEYHRQNKTAIRDFMYNSSATDIMSIRLFNGLKSVDHKERYHYIEDITIEGFVRIRNMGKKSWIEFQELRDLVLSKPVSGF